jgi:pimeloyl-ACP methyl ester carboxylesterase
VLLIHGWGGRARRQWHKTIVDLRDAYHFYALSLRGHGHSEEMRDPNYTFADLAWDCEALRQVVGVERWTVVGYSLGGIVGLHYAALVPERVVAACAVSPMIVGKSTAFALRYGRWPVAWAMRIARRLPPSLSGPMLHNVSKTRLRTLFHTVDMMNQWQPGKTCIPASVPAIIIMGDEDKHAHGERAIAAAPKMDVRMMENTGHFPLWQQRDRFIKELRDVLQTYAR